MTACVQWNVVFVWQGPAIPAAIKAMGAECHVMGDTVRAVLPEQSQDAAIDALRREQLRLVSMTPVRNTLEQYFVESLKRSEKSAGSVA